MDAAGVGDAGKTRWLILIYQLPREPSRHRVAVWRKLKALGALYLQDGAAALPEDAVTREQLEWLQLRVRESGGEATLWEALPNTVAEDRDLVESFRSSREEAYEEIVAGAERVRRKAELGGDREALLADLKELERAFRIERRRDYFRSPRRNEAASAVKTAREAVRGVEGAEEDGEELGATGGVG
ncbi:MAG: chromate resistance protein [Actinobacteria bacterium]|nr:chromate resistance protein [Actinomycetota bacterium]